MAGLGILLFLFWGAFGALFAVWFAYPGVLYLLTRRMTPPVSGAASRPGEEPPVLSIIIAAHNEEKVIVRRLQNILDNAPRDFEMEILVMSDHSTDSTVARAQAMAEKDGRIQVHETRDPRGRASAHNQACKLARGDILFFTDAETLYERDFLDILGHAFDDPKVGFATGKIVWENAKDSTTGENYQLYWRFDIWLREMETRLGMMAVASGPCCAMRRELYREITAEGDIDSVGPLFAVKQGYLAIFVPEARAIDYVWDTAESEFQARVRMTAKNFASTIRVWGWDGIVNFPLHTTGLVLHKNGRWLTPFFVVAMVGCGSFIIMSGQGSASITALTVTAWIGIAMAFLGAVFPSIPLASSLWSFLLANAAFAAGVIKALTKKAPVFYNEKHD